MAQEDQTPKCSNGSGGGNFFTGNNSSCSTRSSKKQKQRKPPQRGLGVAQLEKIRLEEQQKKDAAAIFPAPPTVPHSSLGYLAGPPSNYHTQSNFAPPNAVFGQVSRAPPLLQNFERLNSGTVPLLTPAKNRGMEFERESAAPVVPENFDHMWSHPEQDAAELKAALTDPRSYLFSKPSVPVNSRWLPPAQFQRMRYDQPPSLVNAPPLSTSSASLLNFKIEPPSNQSHHFNNALVLPQEEKMIGMKRPCPFPTENTPAPYYRFDFPIFDHPSNRLNEPSSCDNGNFSYSTEGPSCPPIFEPNQPRSTERDGNFGGEFLTLGPPPTSTRLNSKQPPSALPTLSSQMFPDFESPSLEGFQEGLNFQQVPRGRYHQETHPSYYSYIPPAVLQTNQTSMHMDNRNSNPDGSIDLNLKL